jgi:alkanesulfonate monooxygenase SsuD/methylene tetrahydromethanopterin reductase-like flavin-dependent oxidoreductase (luciferase family)
MLEIAGTLAEGTITWMVGPRTLETHTVPLIQKAAMEAGRSKPRVCVGVPIAVTDDKAAAIETARERFGHYGELPSYRRMLDMEGFESPADVAIVGNEQEVEAKLRQIASAGATELLASVFPVGSDEKASVARTQLLLRTLVGKI